MLFIAGWWEGLHRRDDSCFGSAVVVSDVGLVSAMGCSFCVGCSCVEQAMRSEAARIMGTFGAKVRWEDERECRVFYRPAVFFEWPFEIEGRLYHQIVLHRRCLEVWARVF